jgi:hypothetical protein
MQKNMNFLELVIFQKKLHLPQAWAFALLINKQMLFNISSIFFEKYFSQIVNFIKSFKSLIKAMNYHETSRFLFRFMV